MSTDRKDRHQIVEQIRRDMLHVLNGRRGARSRKVTDAALQKLANKWRQAVGAEFINGLSSCVLRDMGDSGRYYVKLTFSRVYEQTSLISLFGGLDKATLDDYIFSASESRRRFHEDEGICLSTKIPGEEEDRPTEPLPKDRRSSRRPVSKLSLLKGGKA